MLFKFNKARQLITDLRNIMNDIIHFYGSLSQLSRIYSNFSSFTYSSNANAIFFISLTFVARCEPAISQ